MARARRLVPSNPFMTPNVRGYPRQPVNGDPAGATGDPDPDHRGPGGRAPGGPVLAVDCETPATS